MRWTSDPQGLAEIEVAQEAQLSRYRFGTSTAEFLVCRGCGYLMAAVSDGEPRRCVINVDVLAQADAFSESTAANFDGEGVDDRLARRSRTWTPVRLTVGLPG
ncbi:MAG: hypothetical protein K0V04_09125 [Deltaproteobacteria bacterium]|nr:hypothetical protein [Deltaproteobacteria bacterium]